MIFEFPSSRPISAATPQLRADACRDDLGTLAPFLRLFFSLSHLSFFSFVISLSTSGCLTWRGILDDFPYHTISPVIIRDGREGWHLASHQNLARKERKREALHSIRQVART